MSIRVNTVAFEGVRARKVEVQVQIASGLPSFSVVGLPDKAVMEAKERVRAALSALGVALPAKRITINLAPADLPKEGSHFDLPIILAVMAAIGMAPAEELDRFYALGELSLDGSITPVSGVLAAAMQAVNEEMGLICPAANGTEAAFAGADFELIAAPSLTALLDHLKGERILVPPPAALAERPKGGLDLADIKGQAGAKRALEIAAAGGHNMAMVGPPGSGKSMLAARLPGLLPPLAPSEILEVGIIRSLAGEGGVEAVGLDRPFRTPHHSASMAALIGGGLRVKPGEVSLAHGGILFLDELPEFSRQVLDSLRQPLETGQAVVARANRHVTFPARFQLVAAMNPCRCGHLGDAELACSRAPRCAEDYLKKLSGPLMDRIDIHVEVPPVPPAALSRQREEPETSAIVAARIAKARALQQARYADEGVATNAEIDGPALEAVATPDGEGMALLEKAADAMRLTARGYYRVLRVARTIADLAGSEGVSRLHVGEALSYRQNPIGRQYSARDFMA